MNFVDYFMNETSWLYTTIYQNKIFFFDFWSFVHLWSGFSVYLLMRAIGFKRPLTTLVAILAIYELIEILFIYYTFSIFKPETIKDQFTDIIVGISGGTISLIFIDLLARYKEKYPRPLMAFIMFAVSSTCAFTWVGFYHYRYNVDFYNTPGINVSSWLGWTSGGLFIMIIFRYLKQMNLTLRLGLTWLSYFLALLAFEYFYYYILEVREVSGLPLKPLIFGLVHGTRTLHVYYLLAPFIILSVYRLGTWLYSRSLRQEYVRMQEPVTSPQKALKWQ